MIDEVVKMLEADPFEPFMIHTSGGLLDKLGFGVGVRHG